MLLCAIASVLAWGCFGGGYGLAVYSRVHALEYYDQSYNDFAFQLINKGTASSSGEEFSYTYTAANEETFDATVSLDSHKFGLMEIGTSFDSDDDHSIMLSYQQKDGMSLAFSFIDYKLSLEDLTESEATVGSGMNKKKIGIIAGVTLAVTGLSVGGGFAIAHAVQKQSATTTLLLEAKAKSHHDTISATSASIYCAFAKKIAPLALKLNGKTDSLAFSVVDAFVSYSMEVYLSNDNVQASYCQTLGAKNMWPRSKRSRTMATISTYLAMLILLKKSPTSA